MNFEQAMTNAIWVAKTLFDLQRATGSTSNLSFKFDEKIYITGTNTCFGRLKQEDFAILDLEGNCLSEVKPSKEYPLHIMLYKKNENLGAVIHTHSHYSTLWSLEKFDNPIDIIPEHTPYLKMKLGSVCLVEYKKPGTKELFSAFEKALNDCNGYLLSNHGPIIADEDIINAFYSIEELEASCRIAWEKKKNINRKGCY